MKICKKSIVFVVLMLLSIAMILPVAAAKPQKSDCGMLVITTSGEDVQAYMAVCIAEEDGNYVYSGNRPIQQQLGLFVTATNSMDMNNVYNITEDTEYAAVPGVYRFSLDEKVESGSEADVFPEMAKVSKNDTVYFVHLDMNEDGGFVMEKTTVASVRNGILTTRDALERDSDNGDFSVIFNENGDVVGFCKAGVASVPLSGNGRYDRIIWMLAVGIVTGLIVLAGLIIWLVTRKKNVAPQPVYEQPWPPVPVPVESETQLLDAEEVPQQMYALRCHGGYLNGRTYPILPDGITIGRDADNNICYPGQTPGISRHHVRLFWRDGQLLLVDLDSSNGTYLNATGRIMARHPIVLNAGDVFYLGEKRNGFEIVNQ